MLMTIPNRPTGSRRGVGQRSERRVAGSKESRS
ncbi:hypothetical protein FHX69_4975 [Prauserella muralis]|nr:hypothetical protein FHX69_4975 [Prauserella muralis]